MSINHEILPAIQYFQEGKIKQSKLILNKYISRCPDDIDANLLSAAISASESDFSNVVNKCRRVLSIEPGNIRASYNAAVASEKLRQYQDVLEFTLQVLSVDSNNIAAIMLHISALCTLNRQADCIDFINGVPETLVAKTPVISMKLAECYMSNNEDDKAVLIFRQCIMSNVNPAECFHNIGIIEDRRDNINGSINAYKSALDLNPDLLNTNYNLAFILDKSGDKKQALQAINACFKIQDSAKVRQAYVCIVSTASIDIIDEQTIINIQKILDDDTTDGLALSSLVMAIIRHQYPVINELYIKANKSDNDSFIALLKKSIKKLTKCHLLQLFFTDLSITDYETECFLKKLRYGMLIVDGMSDISTENDVSELCSAIAIRCYINGFLYIETSEERKKINDLVCRLDETKVADKVIVSYIAMYVSLYGLYQKNIFNISTHNYDGNFFRLLKIQYDAPVTEEKLYENIDVFSEIEDETSLLVQEQYESNPYPVWQNINVSQPEPVAGIICKISPHISEVNFTDKPDILIAGCGTGSHAIQSAMRIEHKTMTAIDLSRRSLAFAKRKAVEYDLAHIEFSQIDILQISRLDKTFDIVESIGVLHHMQDPLIGLQALVSVLKPGGLMNLGFYSKLGRRYIIKAKSIYDDKDRYITDDEIRQLRAEIMASDDENMVKNISGFKDFYSLHDCRDMVFHENENNYTISELANLIEGAGLEFIGFDFHDLSVLPCFRKLFPGDDASSIMQNWQIFEEKHPDTFSSMYVFWCRKQIQ